MFVLGEETFGTINDWTPEPGSVVCWHPSPDSLTKARQAPISTVPPSHQQARHLRNFREHANRGLDMSRLLIASWDMPGLCDVRVLTDMINAHFHRHDTYQSWFEFTDADDIVRHTFTDPADIDYVPIEHGGMTAAALREHLLATPSPLHWDCVRFAVIARPDNFTFCASIDHIYADAHVLGAMCAEFYLTYTSVLAGEPISLPAGGSYADYCTRQHQHTSDLTLDSPQVRAWVDFFENNDGTLPDPPVTLGDGSGTCDLMFVQVMDERQTAQFDSVCKAAGARFSGGVFACAALAEYELTGAETYYGLVARDTRSTPVDYTTIGWFTGYVPITVPVGASSSFGDVARAAQESFDAGKELANLPFNRVLELAPWLTMPQRHVPLLFHLNATVPPLSTLINAEWAWSNMRIHHDGRTPARFDLRVNRFQTGTHVIVFYPNNPNARQSVARYIHTLKSIYRHAVEQHSSPPLAPDDAQLEHKPA
ncbi:condensation domain-containing protein [Mycobacterium numidiamassiliense]|uniref:condensation domain-containing protein n=1 Tax=Mycobacterium numidiamassiliense TaxID=1841861 RepID=UPI00097DBAA1|nr:condensation domain-containing protein [Mycobacterium numidiamassiliense]